MRPRLLSFRPAVTRASRHDPGDAALQSAAAEFAQLAQRRTRAARQLDLLGRQMVAAQATLDSVQRRMTLLARRIDGIDPSLLAAAPPLHVHAPAQTVHAAPPPYVVPPYGAPAYAAKRPDPPQAPLHTLQVPRMQLQRGRRRPFAPE